MSTNPSTSAPQPGRTLALSLLPAAAAIATLAWFGLRGLVHPVSLLLLLGWLGTGLVLALLRAPALVCAAFPVTMLVFVDAPIEPFDLVLVTLAALFVLPWISARRLPALRLEAIEWRYLLFLACLLTTLAVPHSTRSLLGVAKSYVLGLMAFEVARYAARRFGRPVVLWGLAAMAAITVAMLILRYGGSGVAAFQAMSRRTEVSQLPWGSSNYVAAVLVTLLPATLCLLRMPELSTTARRLAAATFATVLVGMLFTTSRGGFLLALIVLLVASRDAWRVPIRLVLGAAAALAIVLFTPLGAGMIERFSDPQETFSIAARWAVWEAAWERGVTNLPFGIGHGQGRIFGDELGSIDPHNYPLSLFSEGGPLALLVWLALMVGVWNRGRQLQRTPEGRMAGRSLSLLAVIAFLNSLFEPTFTGHLYHTLFWWSVGALDAAQPVAAPERVVQPPG